MCIALLTEFTQHDALQFQMCVIWWQMRKMAPQTVNVGDTWFDLYNTAKSKPSFWTRRDTRHCSTLAGKEKKKWPDIDQLERNSEFLYQIPCSSGLKEKIWATQYLPWEGVWIISCLVCGARLLCCLKQRKLLKKARPEPEWHQRSGMSQQWRHQGLTSYK